MCQLRMPNGTNVSFKRGMMHGICEVNSGKKIPIKWDVSNEEKGRHHWIFENSQLYAAVSNTEPYTPYGCSQLLVHRAQAALGAPGGARSISGGRYGLRTLVQAYPGPVQPHPYRDILSKWAPSDTIPTIPPGAHSLTCTRG